MVPQAGRTERKFSNAGWLTSGALPRLLAVLDHDGEEARAVGGAVRNALLGAPVLEVDVATTAVPDEIVKRVTAAGAFASVAVTAVTWLAFFRAADFGANPNFMFYGMLPVTPIFVSSLLALVGVSLITAAPGERTLRRYFPEKAAAARSEALADAAAVAD